MANHNTASVLKSLEKAYSDRNITQWRMLLQKNEKLFDPASFQYDLGLTYLAEGDLPWARYYFEQAWRILQQRPVASAHPFFSSIENARQYTTEKISYSLDQSTRSLDHFGREDLISFSFVTSSVLTLIIFLVFIRKKLWSSHSVIFLLLIMSLPLLIFKIFTWEIKEAVVFSAAEVYPRPSYWEKAEFLSSAGSKVLIRDLNSEEAWVYVEWPLSARGWVERKKLGILK